MVLLHCLGKAETRINPHILRALTVEDVEPFGEIAHQRVHNIIVVGHLLHLRRKTTGVHQYVGHLQLTDRAKHIGIQLTTADIVHHVGTGLDSGSGWLGIARIHTQYCLRQRCAQAPYRRGQTLRFHIGWQQLGPRTRTHHPDIHDIGPFQQQPPGMRHHGILALVATAVVERIASHIQYAHHGWSTKLDQTPLHADAERYESHHLHALKTPCHHIYCVSNGKK